MAQIAAEALGVELSAVKVTKPDTHQSTNAGASAGSRTTFVSGNAVLEAAKPIRQTLLQVAAEETGLPVELLSLRGSRLYAEDEELSLSVADLAAQAKWKNRRLHADGFYAMEYPEPYAPYGSKGIGEASLTPTSQRHRRRNWYSYSPDPADGREGACCD